MAQRWSDNDPDLPIYGNNGEVIGYGSGLINTRGITWQGTADDNWANTNARGKQWRWNDDNGSWQVQAPNGQWINISNVDSWDGTVLDGNGNKINPWATTGKSGGSGGSGGGGVDYSAIARMNRDSALEAIEGARRGMEWQLGQLDKNYNVSENLLRKAQEQAEKEAQVQSHVNSADWRTGENSALKGASDIATGGASELANAGIQSGSMLNDLYNKAIAQFGGDEQKVNTEYGKAQSINDASINGKRRQTELEIAKAWDEMMNQKQKAQNDYYNQARQFYTTAASNDVQAGGNGQQYLDAMKNLPNPDDFERRADKVDTLYTPRPISDFYKNTKIGISNNFNDNRVSGRTTPTQTNTLNAQNNNDLTNTNNNTQQEQNNGQ